MICCRFLIEFFFFIHALGKYSLTVSCVTAWRGLLSSGERERHSKEGNMASQLLKSGHFQEENERQVEAGEAGRRERLGGWLFAEHGRALVVIVDSECGRGP